jgi:hypothetical protein
MFSNLREVVVMSSSEEERRRIEAENLRRLRIERENKEAEEYRQKRKELRAEQERAKVKRAEEQVKRQQDANKAVEGMIGEALNGEQNGTPENGPRTYGSSTLKVTLLGGIGGASTPRASGTRDRSMIKAPAGAKIPGLEQARADREKQKKYVVNEGGRFTSNTSTGRGSTGATAATSSSLRKGFRF